MNDYDINTIYPPREDLFIGDIYANIYTPNCNATLDNSECTFTSIRIARIPVDNVNKMISSHHDNTLSFAPEGDGCQFKEVEEADQEGKTKTYLPSKECFTKDAINPSDSYQQLKQIAFPNFYKHKGNSSQASTAALVKILPKAGIGINNITEYSVAIPAARYYSVNPFEMLDALQNLPPEQSQKLQRVKEYKEMVCSQCRTKIFIPYQIYYTRELDITYKGNFYANRKYNQTRDPSIHRMLYTPPADSNDDTKKASESLIEETNFGVTTTLSHASTGDIGVRQVFDTPMAIGYKGFIYDDHEEIKNKLAAIHKASYELASVAVSETPSPSKVAEELSDESSKATADDARTDSPDGAEVAEQGAADADHSESVADSADATGQGAAGDADQSGPVANSADATKQGAADADHSESVADSAEATKQEAADTDHSGPVAGSADATKQGAADADQSVSVVDSASVVRQQTEKLLTEVDNGHASQ